MLQELIINLQQEYKITICIGSHSNFLQIVDTAMILSNGKIVAEGSPSNIIKDINAQKAYFEILLKLANFR